MRLRQRYVRGCLLAGLLACVACSPTQARQVVDGTGSSVTATTDHGVPSTVVWQPDAAPPSTAGSLETTAPRPVAEDIEPTCMRLELADLWADTGSALVPPLLVGDLRWFMEALAAGGDPNEVVLPHGSSPLGIAVALGCTEAVEMLLAVGAKPDGHSTEVPPLSEAVAVGHLEVVERLLAAGADPNRIDDEGNTALHNSGLERSAALRIVGLLLDAGADPAAENLYGDTPVDHFALNGWLEGVEAIAVLDPTLLSVNTLYNAVAEDRAEVLSFLLDAGLDPASPPPVAYESVSSLRELAESHGAALALAVLDANGA